MRKILSKEEIKIYDSYIREELGKQSRNYCARFNAEDNIVMEIDSWIFKEWEEDKLLKDLLKTPVGKVLYGKEHE